MFAVPGGKGSSMRERKGAKKRKARRESGKVRRNGDTEGMKDEKKQIVRSKGSKLWENC